MRKNYSEESQWYLTGHVGKLYKIYQKILVELHPLSGHVLVQCPQCQIEFVTTSSNRGRKDIRCFFGCQLIHRKIQSNKRSMEYNKTFEGKAKKKTHNQRRSKAVVKPAEKPISTIPSIIDIYIRLFLAAVLKNKMQLTKIQELRQKVHEELRQHTLERIVELLIVRGYG